MKTWLKFGIVCVIIDALLMVYAIISSSPWEADLLALSFLGAPLSWAYLLFIGVSYPIELIIFGIVGLINWFIIGSLIGIIFSWIRKKIKAKKF